MTVRTTHTATRRPMRAITGSTAVIGACQTFSRTTERFLMMQLPLLPIPAQVSCFDTSPCSFDVFTNRISLAQAIMANLVSQFSGFQSCTNNGPCQPLNLTVVPMDTAQQIEALSDSTDHNYFFGFYCVCWIWGSCFMSLCRHPLSAR